MKISLTLVALITALGSLRGAEPTTKEQPPRVTVVQLVKEPSKFEGMRVEVEGYWITGFEWSYFTATADNPEPLPIWLERWMIDPSEPQIDVAAIKLAVEGADKNAHLEPSNSSRQYWVRCIGRFSHVIVRRSTPAAPGVGFGHLGVYPSKLRLEKIIEVRAMPLPNDFFPRLPD